METVLQRNPLNKTLLLHKHHYRIHILAESDERYAWLQQDGAMCHTSPDILEVLTEFFDDCVISKGLWPTLSPDLLIQDFFLWGYLKNVTFRNNPHTFDELKSNILHSISDINSHSFREVSINLVKRVRLCVQENGHHFENLL
ncbi:uncharacterized protein TNCV_4798191 [Trichonephila clavipes]|nr:uncharacterized protein TNCV_4798191 [Trichonephila clavipes]